MKDARQGWWNRGPGLVRAPRLVTCEPQACSRQGFSSDSCQLPCDRLQLPLSWAVHGADETEKGIRLSTLALVAGCGGAKVHKIWVGLAARYTEVTCALEYTPPRTSPRPQADPRRHARPLRRELGVKGTQARDGGPDSPWSWPGPSSILKGCGGVGRGGLSQWASSVGGCPTEAPSLSSPLGLWPAVAPAGPRPILEVGGGRMAAPRAPPLCLGLGLGCKARADPREAQRPSPASPSCPPAPPEPGAAGRQEDSCPACCPEPEEGADSQLLCQRW